MHGCSSPESTFQQYNISISDELSPAGLLPERVEINSEGKLIMLTNRFNDDNTIYQKNFFLELNPSQQDTIIHWLTSLTHEDLSNMQTVPGDSVIYKINIGWIKNKQHNNFFLIGNRFSPGIHQIINFSRQAPTYSHRFKLKESHYFSTAEFCIGKPNEYPLKAN
ncbi:MAG: hypothetical protein CVU09_09030 [Bacteroidetes bacterium HGW-Bacteroidetes-4]|nr:MAG: hypothetical protein CVU09_09030 [Bacteroidetes bacterium HGW-Bacteroidetes-4]